MKKIVFVRGLPGSGKSTIAGLYEKKYHDSCYVCSTDEYWMRPDNTYDFNWELLGQSHAWNQSRVEGILTEEGTENRWDTVVVVDNTNITFREMKPYIKMALDNGFKVYFIEPNTTWKYDVEECFKKNAHGVPYATILKMSQRWEDLQTVKRKYREMR